MATLSTFFDMVYVYATESSGHGPFTLGAAVTGFQTAAAAGITNGTPVSYRATDGTNWETAHGVVDVSGSTYTLTRGVDTIKSSNSNSLVSFGSGVTVAITELSQDLNMLVSAGAAQSFTSSQQALARTNINANIGAIFVGSSSRNPAAVTSTTGIMLGLGAAEGSSGPGMSAAITPSKSGTVLFIGTLIGYNTTATTDFVRIQLYYGTGAAPAAGVALTGTVLNGSLSNGQLLSGASYTSATMVALITGLTLGTTYWLDFAADVGAGSGSLANPSIQAFEL